MTDHFDYETATEEQVLEYMRDVIHHSVVMNPKAYLSYEDLEYAYGRARYGQVNQAKALRLFARAYKETTLGGSLHGNARRLREAESGREPWNPHETTTDAAQQSALDRAVERERATQEARAIVAEERQLKRFRQPEEFRSLSDELELPTVEDEWRIDGLLPAGGNLLIAAGFKTGKTTLIQNLVRSLVDREPFLGQFPTVPLDGRVALMNFELTRAQQVRWLSESGIGNSGQVMLAHLRGQSGILTTGTGREWVTQQLRSNEVEFWVVDPLARAASGVDENSNTEMGLFLEQLDEIKANAGVRELVLVTHTGRTTPDSPARARGATRVNDWADVNLTMVKDSKEVRSFTAEGRDVLVGKTRLSYDPATRRMAVLGEEELLMEAASGLVAEVVAVAAAGGPEGVSGNQLETTIKGRAVAIREARSLAIAQGLLREDTSGRWPRFVATHGQQVAF